ncbi:OmpH family outer membrane protein [Pseudorhodoferax sp.]|uniref:OmpH family outer membrane protein n=1 Tax=Pseudorhodoferax sp. TaxID=1993553 RepID=UPI0039E218A2
MKTFLRPFGAALLLSLAAACAHAQAEEVVRIGFINIDRLLREANPAKQGQSKLEAEFSKREKDLMEAGNQLKSASEKFEREAPTMAESQRAARQRQLAEQDRDFQRKRREFQEDLNARKNEELQQVIDKANRVIKQVAETEKYDAILQEAAYINPRLDITDKVIKALNAASPAK